MNWKHWVVGSALGLLLSIDGFGCAEGAYFRGQTPQAMAECRNVWRLTANTCMSGVQGLGVALECRAQGANAYDDCMRAKGFQEEPP